MVKQQEFNKSYEISFRMFIIEFENSSKKFLFTGSDVSAIKEYAKIKKAIKAPYGGKITEIDPYDGISLHVLKRFK